jgi:hypothetical protein
MNADGIGLERIVEGCPVPLLESMGSEEMRSVAYRAIEGEKLMWGYRSGRGTRT